MSIGEFSGSIFGPAHTEVYCFELRDDEDDEDDEDDDDSDGCTALAGCARVCVRVRVRVCVRVFLCAL